MRLWHSIMYYFILTMETLLVSNQMSAQIIIEKEENLGGNLNLFIHDGFGNFYLGEKVTGPEFSSIMIDDYKKLGGKYLTSSKVLEINADKRITVINPDKGVYDI